MRQSRCLLPSRTRVAISKGLIVTLIAVFTLPAIAVGTPRKNNLRLDFNDAAAPTLEPFALSILVNVTGDGDNVNPTTGCDTDPATPGEQCSLRAAIQQANLIAPGVLEDPELQLPYLLLRENVINRLYDQNIGYWHGLNDYVLWTVNVPKAGVYDVYLDWACDNASAGNRFSVEAGPASFAGEVAGTGGWSQYLRVRVGHLKLDPGLQQVKVRPAGPADH